MGPWMIPPEAPSIAHPLTTNPPSRGGGGSSVRSLGLVNVRLSLEVPAGFHPSLGLLHVLPVSERLFSCFPTTDGKQTPSAD